MASVSWLDLARLLGLELGVGRVTVDPTLQASRPGVFAAGEVTGIGGAPLAAAEGRLAGIAAARHLGRPAAADSERVRELQRARQVHARFAATIERIYSPVPVLSAATPETTLCRCEGVTLGDLRRARSRPWSQPTTCVPPRPSSAAGWAPVRGGSALRRSPPWLGRVAAIPTTAAAPGSAPR